LKIHKDINSIRDIKKPILTVGTFDGVHIGHQSIIQRVNDLAKDQEGQSVLLTFHPHPRMVLFPDDDSLKLINTIEEKMSLLESFGLDHVIVIPFEKAFSRMSPVEYVRDILVNKIGIHTIVIGYDHHFGRNRQGDLMLLKELAPLYEFNVEEIPAQDIDEITVSSTKVRNAILEGHIRVANDFLGYKFTISGKVVSGKKIGREMGFPTANIQLDDRHKIIPGDGVYAVKGIIDAKEHEGMLNIGTRPTIDDKGVISIEVHFFNMSADLYDKEIQIIFERKMRNEQKFEDINSLQNQLQADANMVAKYFSGENID
jgi:riboflavin kinase/FMN adenylyltransferase